MCDTRRERKREYQKKWWAEVGKKRRYEKYHNDENYRKAQCQRVKDIYASNDEYRNSSIAKAKQWRQDNADRYNSTKKVYRVKTKSHIADYNHEYQINNQDKILAHKTVYQAIKKGTLIKSTTCEQCGSADYIEAHHDNYNYPLQVKWLCRKCHREWHKNNDPIRGQERKG